jgi:hypothetical protein
MSQTITLELPDNFLKPLKRTAKVTKQPIETLLLNHLQTSLPPIEDLPKDLAANLTLLENLDDSELKTVLRETVSLKTQEKISNLLAKRKEQTLTATESKTLENLQKEADLTMLRKARAAVLLRFRGVRLPTLAELSQIK